MELGVREPCWNWTLFIAIADREQGQHANVLADRMSYLSVVTNQVRQCSGAACSCISCRLWRKDYAGRCGELSHLPCIDEGTCFQVDFEAIHTCAVLVRYIKVSAAWGDREASRCGAARRLVPFEFDLTAGRIDGEHGYAIIPAARDEQKSTVGMDRDVRRSQAPERVGRNFLHRNVIRDSCNGLNERHRPLLPIPSHDGQAHVMLSVRIAESAGGMEDEVSGPGSRYLDRRPVIRYEPLVLLVETIDRHAIRSGVH